MNRIRRYDVGADESWASTFLDARLGGRWQARRGTLVDVLEPGLGFIAEADGVPAGLLTYRVDRDATELTALAADPRGTGLGTLLLAALVGAAAARGGTRIWVVTTNDNIDALRFYQRRGFRLADLRAGAVDMARETIKPAIGHLGGYGIPIRDEIELRRDVESSDRGTG